MVQEILRRVKALDGLQGPLGAEMWDSGDAVGCWAGERLAAVLFPTADSLERLHGLAEAKPTPPELLLMFNPQWSTTSSTLLSISDFGLGAGRDRKLALVSTFHSSYALRQQRVYGDDVRVLRAHPGAWQLHQVARDGQAELLGVQDSSWEYKDIEAELRSRGDSSINKPFWQRAQDELRFVNDSLKTPPGGGGGGGQEGGGGGNSAR